MSHKINPHLLEKRSGATDDPVLFLSQLPENNSPLFNLVPRGFATSLIPSINRIRESVQSEELDTARSLAQSILESIAHEVTAPAIDFIEQQQHLWPPRAPSGDITEPQIKYAEDEYQFTSYLPILLNILPERA